jgi:hypothetical protein
MKNPEDYRWGNMLANLSPKDAKWEKEWHTD